MRTLKSAPSLAGVLLALSLGAAGCGEPGPAPSASAAADTSAPRYRGGSAASSAERLSGLVKQVSASAAPAPAARTRFGRTEALELTLTDLREGRHVLVSNPGPSHSIRLAVDDDHETLPLSRVLAVVDTVTLRAGTAAEPSTTLVRLTALPAPPRPRAGTYEGWLVMSGPDSLRVRRQVRVTVPRPVTAALPEKPDTAWTASVDKLALSPPARAWLFDNAEGRCSRDNRDREGFAATPVAAGIRYVVGTCLRDNTIPLAGARSRGSAPLVVAAHAQRTAAGKADSVVIEQRYAQTLLGVLYAESGGDQALVWWSGDPLEVKGVRQGVELQFTSLDHPGAYYGRIDLAGAGAEGVVGLRVRVTHDWPLPLIVITLGVFLSAWLRSYVRTRRAVLRMQETAADLVSRIEAANDELQRADSEVWGYRPYPVDEKLLLGLRKLERQLAQHAYDGTVLEPGKPEHDDFRRQLDQCEADVVAWESLAGVFAELREALRLAQPLEEHLRPGDVPALLGEMEKLFDGGRIGTAAVAELDERVRDACEAVGSWNEVAQAAVDLQAQIDRTADSPERTAAQQALTEAVTALWAAPDVAATQLAGGQVAAAAKLLQRPRVLKVFGFPGFAGGRKADTRFDALEGAAKAAAPGAPGASPLEAIAQVEQALKTLGFAPESPPAADAAAESPQTVRAALRARRARDEERRQTAAERRARAEARRKRNDRWYFLLTLSIAAATGLNQLYFTGAGFGSMKDYMVALLWGFGTKLGLDTVRAAVEGGRLPWSSAAGAAQTTQQNANPQNPQNPNPQNPNPAQPKIVVPDDQPAKPPQGEYDPEKDGVGAGAAPAPDSGAG